MSTDPAVTPGAPPTNPGAPPPVHTDQPDWAAFSRVAVIAAVAGWVVFAIAGFANLGAASEEHKHEAQWRFLVGYLSGFTFWASLPIGAMALLMIRYLAKTSWGLLLTRPFEAATRTLPLLIVLFVPLAIAVATADMSPYWWSHPEETPKHAVSDTMPEQTSKAATRPPRPASGTPTRSSKLRKRSTSRRRRRKRTSARGTTTSCRSPATSASGSCCSRSGAR